jgi:6-pyruvoyltetrahydropterin/6-carboxytetrahydropterin synthase
MRIVFERRFSMAHRLIADPLSKCATPHGHNEFVRVELATDARPDMGGSNRVAPFERLKARWHGWIDGQVDHAFQLAADDPLVAWFRDHEPQRLSRLMLFEGDPTTEALTLAFWRKLSAFLRVEAPEFRLVALSVQETPTNTVALDAAGAAALADWRPAPWCERADDSINDLALPAAAPAARTRA